MFALQRLTLLALCTGASLHASEIGRPLQEIKFSISQIVNCRGDKKCKEFMARMIQHQEKIAELGKKQLNNAATEEETITLAKLIDPSLGEKKIEEFAQFSLDGASCETLEINLTKISDNETHMEFAIDTQLPDMVPLFSQGHFTLLSLAFSAKQIWKPLLTQRKKIKNDKKENVTEQVKPQAPNRAAAHQPISVVRPVDKN